MKLDRNERGDGTGRYAVVDLRMGEPRAVRIDGKDCWATPRDSITFGYPGSREEFFVIKLKDKNAEAALLAYADSCEADDPEFAADVRELARRAGPNHPLCKRPD